MTKNEAIEFEKELKKYVINEAELMNLSSEQVIEVLDQYVEIYPDKLTSMGMFDLGDRSKSIRPGNIHFNLRGFLEAAAGLGSSAVIPQDTKAWFVLALNCFLFVCGVSDSITKEISENEAYIVAFLHTHNMYDHGLLEENFGTTFNTWYKEKTGEKMTPQKMQKALDNLYKMKSADIVTGEIRLVEKVWRNKL